MVDGLGGLLDERDDVAHAEDAVGDAGRVELLQRVDLLADADELDRLAGDGAHRQSRAAAGIAVHPGQDDAGDAEALVEGAGGVDRVLAGERVGDEQHLVGLRRGLHLGGLGHQALVHRGAAGGVEHHHVEPAETGGVHGALGDLHRRLAGDDRQALHADLLGQHRELLHGGRAARVEGGEQHLALLAVGEAPGDLGGGRGLARALQADHQDRGGRRRR